MTASKESRQSDLPKLSNVSFTVLVWLMCLAMLYSSIAVAQPPTLEQAAQIRDLIEQLGSSKFEERESAQNQLEALMPMAQEQLAKATLDDDTERAGRAKFLLRLVHPPSHRVVDAFGQPIVGAKIVLLSGNARDYHRSTVRYCGAHGQVGYTPSELEQSPVFEISHAAYGIARVTRPMPDPGPDAGPDAPHEAPNFNPRAKPNAPKAHKPTPRLAILKTPLIKNDHPHADRAVHGTVLDADKRPLKDVEIECASIRTAGMGLINAEYPKGVAVTDAKGEFRLYMPAAHRREALPETGTIIPPKSSFNLQVNAPREDCFPTMGMFVNGVKHEIQLGRAKHFHEFRFETGEGEPQSATRGQASVSFRKALTKDSSPLGRQSAIVPLKHADIANGRKLMDGEYTATFSENGATIRFEPIQVTAASPRVLVFRQPPDIVFSGRVVHGKTGRPIPNAWVMGTNGSAYNNLAAITEEEWKTLAEAGPASAEALQLLRRHYVVKALIRADKEGRFSITQQPDGEFYGITAFEKDFLPCMVRQSTIKPQKGRGDVGELPLFPAGKAWVHVNHKDRLSIGPKWVFGDVAGQEWLRKLKGVNDSSERDLLYVHWMKRNVRTPVFVPSDVPLRIRFEAPYDPQWTPSESREIRVKQGESVDLDAVRLSESLKVEVRIVDAQGNPVEGVPVRRMHSGIGGWCVPHNTDAEGKAFFFVYPNSSGEIRILDLKGPEAVTKAKNLGVSFTANTTPLPSLKIQMTDAQLQLFR